MKRNAFRAPQARRAARRNDRGVTVLVVVLVIAMLSAVGVFASKSASLALAQGGYMRQATQTHYVTQYALDATLAAVSGDVPGYVAEIEEFGEDKVAAYSGTSAWAGCQTPTVGNRRCYKFGRDSLATRFGLGPLLVAPTATTGLLGSPGSLGRSSIDGNFIVEATDLAQVMAPVAGERATGAPVSYYSVTFSAIANVGPPVATVGTPEDQLRTAVSSVEGARVQATLGPVPAR